MISCSNLAATGLQADSVANGARLDVRAFARPLERHTCTVMLTGGQGASGSVVQATCRRPRVILARSSSQRTARPRYLRSLLSGGRSPARVSDREIRVTAEYLSLMDPYNRWQWKDQVTSAEDLAMCRAMLGDLHSLRRVDWESHARLYLERVRRQQARNRRPDSRRADTDQGGDRPGGRADSPRPDMADPTPRPEPSPPSADGGPANRPDSRPDGRPDSRLDSRPVPPMSAPVAIDINRLLDRSWQLRYEGRLRRQRGDRRESLWTELEQRLTEAEEHIGALNVLLSGVSIVISGVVIRGEATEVTIEAVGEMTGDPELNLRLSRPAVEELAENLHKLGDLEDALGSPTGAYQSPLDQVQQDAYRRLLRTPTGSLSDLDLEQLDRLHRLTGDASEPRPGSRLHKAARWRKYQERPGQWPFERWSTTYEQNVTRAPKAHARADRLRDKLGWGQRELRVNLPDGGVRVLDIGDEKLSRAVEVKRGYVRLNADTAMQLRKDAVLVDKKKWSITWHVDGRCSQSVRDVLRTAKIKLIELRADMPIKDL